MSDLLAICHTNSECFDILDIFVSRYQRFSDIKLKLLSDKKYKDYDCFVYNNSLSYRERWISVLLNCEETHILTLHEDFILYNNIHLDNNYIGYDFIRLQKNGIFSNINITENIFKIENGDHVFSMTPCIWKKEILLSLLLNSKTSTVWELENENIYYSGLNGGYYYCGEAKRGLSHYDSNIFPCILSAINKGKWNYSEYKYEIDFIVNEFKVDIFKRGIV